MFAEFLLAFIPIFVAVDAVGLLPIFVSLTDGIDRKTKNTIVIQSMATASCLAIGFIIAGRAIFKFLGITIEDFMIAGGAILFCIAILDLVAHNKVERRAASELAAVPIGTPLMVGPAVLTTSLISIDQYGIAITMIAVLVNIFIAGATFVFSDLLIRLIGKAGANALSKVFSLFLAAIAVMMMRRGILKIISSHFLPGII